MDTREIIQKIAKERQKFTTADIVIALKHTVSRQTVSLEIRKLVKEGFLTKGGSTKSAFYALPENITKLDIQVHERLQNDGLEEHTIFNSFKEKAPFLKLASDNVFSIVQYAFDEMLNNAIEHSQSEHIEIDMREGRGTISFEIRDFGIGVFRNIMNKRQLKSELEAMQDLLKGKTTTAPKAHSGEGIFFTSKVMDVFTLESFGWRLRIDNRIPDIFVEEITPVERGTKVICQIDADSPRHLNEVFQKYQSENGDLAFDKTEIHIRLFTMGTVYVSRSQARRVLSGLEKFKTVIMDFDKVPTVGQAFADEIFRVFKLDHPDIEVVPINMNKAVEFMVGRVEKV